MKYVCIGHIKWQFINGWNNGVYWIEILVFASIFKSGKEWSTQKRIYANCPNAMPTFRMKPTVETEMNGPPKCCLLYKMQFMFCQKFKTFSGNRFLVDFGQLRCSNKWLTCCNLNCLIHFHINRAISFVEFYQRSLLTHNSAASAVKCIIKT